VGRDRILWEVTGNPDMMLIEEVVGLFTKRVGKILKTCKDTCSLNVSVRFRKPVTAVKSFCYKS
jgi:hypothetical protein